MSRLRSGRLFAAIAATAILAAVSAAVVGLDDARPTGIEWGFGGIEWGLNQTGTDGGIEWGAPALHEVAVSNAG